MINKFYSQIVDMLTNTNNRTVDWFDRNSQFDGAGFERSDFHQRCHQTFLGFSNFLDLCFEAKRSPASVQPLSSS